MKQVFLLSLMILMLVSCNSKKEQLCTSTWQDEAIVVDGQNNDWGGTLRYSDTTAKLSYDVRNDAENLYLIVETNDNSMRMKLMHTGLKVSLGLKSDPTATAAITIPAFMGQACMHNRQGMPDSACKEGRNPKPELKDERCPRPCGTAKDSLCDKPCGDIKDAKGTVKGKALPDACCHMGTIPGMPDSAACMNHMSKRKSATAEGFKYSNGNIKCCPADTGKIFFAAGMNNPQTLTCEIVVPLREIYGDGYDLARVAAGKIKLELAVEAMESQSCPGMMKEGHRQGGSGDSLKGHCCKSMPGGSGDSLKGHCCKSMPGGSGASAPDSLKGHCCKSMHSACKHAGKSEGIHSGPCKHEGRPEGKQGVPPEKMGQPFAMPDTTILLQKQNIQCNITLATGK